MKVLWVKNYDVPAYFLSESFLLSVKLIFDFVSKNKTESSSVFNRHQKNWSFISNIYLNEQNVQNINQMNKMFKSVSKWTKCSKSTNEQLNKMFKKCIWTIEQNVHPSCWKKKKPSLRTVWWRLIKHSYHSSLFGKIQSTCWIVIFQTFFVKLLIVIGLCWFAKFPWNQFIFWIHENWGWKYLHTISPHVRFFYEKLVFPIFHVFRIFHEIYCTI